MRNTQRKRNGIVGYVESFASWICIALEIADFTTEIRLLVRMRDEIVTAVVVDHRNEMIGAPL